MAVVLVVMSMTVESMVAPVEEQVVAVAPPPQWVLQPKQLELEPSMEVMVVQKVQQLTHMEVVVEVD